MKTFEVTLYIEGHATFRVRAETKAEANNIALDRGARMTDAVNATRESLNIQVSDDNYPFPHLTEEL